MMRMIRTLSRTGNKTGFIWIALFLIMCNSSCRSVDLFERLRNIPGGIWQQSEQLTYGLDIPVANKDYYIYAIIRHTTKYPYRNIWIRMGLQFPGADTATYQNFNIPLANNERWLGAGMNDVYERRVRLFDQPVRFGKTGRVIFTLQQIMRDDPLEGVLQAGIRIEPVP